MQHEVHPETGFFGSGNRYRIFVALKYATYFLLTINVFLFLQEELLALEHTFVDGIELAQLGQVFSATIDTAAWVVLLLLFELETWVLNDELIKGRVKWTLHGVRAVCAVFIVYAFLFGYYPEMLTLYQVAPLPLADLCSLVGQDFSLLLDLDEYAALDAGNCQAVSGQLYQWRDFHIVADAATLESARYLAWTDVINAGAWILVVIVLEVEVRMQLRGGLTDHVLRINKVIKFLVYAVLFTAAAYWGYAGDFLDFWDAFLWLFAFIFIEMNVFEWQYATQHEAAAD
jgi:hypothetical protein